MSASLIATEIELDELFGALLVGASIVLTTHSLSRMIFLRRTASKYNLFPIINIAQFINQWCVFLLICTAFETITFETALWLNVVNNVAYFITKPVTMYLAYVRCSAVFPPFLKFRWLHYFLIGFRAAELFVIIIVNIIQNELCNGSVAKGTRCEGLAIAWTFRDAGAPVFRFYYILCEAIFYYKLFSTLKGMSSGKNTQLIQYRRLQTSLFTLDLVLLIFMSIYRIIGIFNKNLPTYVYYELFSSTLTIFTLTEFGLNIRMLFGTVASEGKTGDNASHSESSPSKHEMNSIPRNSLGGVAITGVQVHRHNSTSPLTSYAQGAGYSTSEFDLSDPYHHAPSSTATTLMNSPSANAAVAGRATSPKPPMTISFSDPASRSSHGMTYVDEWGRVPSPVPRGGFGSDGSEKHIITPAKFQSQAERGFYEEVGQRRDANVTKPDRARLP
ncbi:hypothetical protein BGZ94_007924 [Podila epigama]|nr:hypothetical protein BGZ94_007924 [Podila epigama]